MYKITQVILNDLIYKWFLIFKMIRIIGDFLYSYYYNVSFCVRSNNSNESDAL